MLLGILLTIHILVCIALIGVVLLQRSEGGALGMGGGGGGGGGFMSARGTGDLLTRTTWILFAIFLGLSITLTLLASRDRSNSIIDRVTIDALDPDALNRSADDAPPPVSDEPPAPAPLTTPTPTIRTPLTPAQDAPATPTP